MLPEIPQKRPLLFISFWIKCSFVFFLFFVICLFLLVLGIFGNCLCFRSGTFPGPRKVPGLIFCWESRVFCAPGRITQKYRKHYQKYPKYKQIKIPKPTITKNTLNTKMPKFSSFFSCIFGSMCFASMVCSCAKFVFLVFLAGLRLKASQSPPA